MGRIFIVMGKTSSGKDTVYKQVLEGLWESLGEAAPKTVVIYTTRPMRPGEQNGVEYFFVTEEELQKLREQGKVMEERCFHTVHGPWYYFTVNDGQIDLEKNSYLMINTLAGYEMIRNYYNAAGRKDIANGQEETVIPIYIEADPKDRLLRYINRESLQKNPNYKEVCRRFLADEEDFAEEKLERLGISKRYLNQELDVCCKEIKADIAACITGGANKSPKADSPERGQTHG